MSMEVPWNYDFIIKQMAVYKSKRQENGCLRDFRLLQLATYDWNYSVSSTDYCVGLLCFELSVGQVTGQNLTLNASMTLLGINTN